MSGSSGSSDCKESACSAGDLGSVPGLERSPGGGSHSRALSSMATHSSILAWRIPMDRGVWPAMVHGVAKSQTRQRIGDLYVSIYK